MLKRSLLVLIIVMMIVFGFVRVALAQTPEAPPQEAMGEDGVPVVITQEATETTDTVTVVTVSSDEPAVDPTPGVVVVETTKENYLNLILAFFAGLIATILAGGSLLMIVLRASQSKDVKDSTEALLAASLPGNTLDKIHSLFELVLTKGIPVATAVAQFAVDVTDGEPNQES